MTDQSMTNLVHMGVKGKGGPRFRLKIRHVVLVGFVLWGSYTYWFVQRPILKREDAQRMALEQQIAGADTETKNLSEQIVLLHSYSYIASVAQQKYNLVKGGDILFTEKNK